MNSDVTEEQVLALNLEMFELPDSRSQLAVVIQDFITTERERCAKIAESVSGAWEQCGAQIAETIRREPS